MIKEAYVSFEIAKLLKEKGFDELSYLIYDENGHTDSYKFYEPVRNKEIVGYTKVTHQMAMAWLREEKNIFISISYKQHSYENSCCELCYDDCRYSYEINGINGNDAYNLGISVNSYEEAVEAALLYTLKNLI